RPGPAPASAHAAPQLRQPPAGILPGPARRAGTARPRRHRHHPDLHPPGFPAPGQGLRQQPSARAPQERAGMGLQLITRDLADTLWEVAPVLENAETALREWLLTHAPLIGAEDVERLWDIRSALVTAEPALRHRISELRRRVLLQALGEVGYADQDALRLAEQAFEVFLAARHRVSLFP